jgi:hypothetical protein
MRFVIAALAVLVLGLGSAYAALRSGFAGGDVSNGPWRTSLVTGSPDADPYTRARVAIGGLLALAPSETIYFTASTDDAGDSLSARCDYRLEGRELAARWWSVTAYAADDYLIPNDGGRYSLSQTTLARESPGGAFRALVSPEPHDGNWLPSGRSGEAGAFSLTLRLYNPAPGVAASPATAELPAIVREACR